VILTIDFGTSVTKVALWNDEGLVALARTPLATAHPHLGWGEQEPFSWWTSVVVASAQARTTAPAAFASVDLVVCSAARQTFVPVTAAGDPIGKGLLWSDRRALPEAQRLSEELGGSEAIRANTGVPLDAGAVAAKISWLEDHEPDRLGACSWLLSPRDLVVWRLTGAVVTDQTLACEPVSTTSMARSFASWRARPATVFPPWWRRTPSLVNSEPCRQQSSDCTQVFPW
jgi:xylulokinase